MRTSLWVVLIWLLVRAPANAQFSGRVTGAVVDASGGAVPGATVNLYLSGGQRPLVSTKTAADGSYHLLGMRPAYYDLTVEASGFIKTTLRGISVDPSRETAVQEIKLALPTLTQSVEV